METRAILYCPPSPELLEHFAYEVCHALGDDYTAPDVVYGLAGLLKALAHAQAKAMNRKTNGMREDGAL